MKRIDWTVFEQSQIFAATFQLVQNRKLQLPVEGSPGCSSFLQAMRDAQVGALPGNRQRTLSSIDAVTGDLLKRFQDNGVLPRDLKTLRRGYKLKEKSDPRDLRIAALEEQVKKLEGDCSLANDQRSDAWEQIKALQARPDAMTVVQQWVAKTLSLALIAAEDAKKPHALRIEPVKEVLPEFERARRKHPEQAASAAGIFKPKLAIIGGQAADHLAISRDFEGARINVDLRYFSPQPGTTVYDSLKQIASSGGAVLLWHDHAHQSVEAQLKARQISYHRHDGNLVSVIERLHGFAETIKAKHEGRTT